MNKIRLSRLGAALMSILLLISCGSSTAANPPSAPSPAAAAEPAPAPSPSEPAATSQPVPSDNTAVKITLEDAKRIALEDAALKESEVTFTQTELETDDGRKKYDIEFLSGSQEYDYEIDAATGKILSVDQEREHVQKPQAQSSSSALIPQEQALDAALAQAGIKIEDVSKKEIKLEMDDGIQKYEIEFVAKGKEYEAEIDASTGKVLKLEIDD